MAYLYKKKPFSTESFLKPKYISIRKEQWAYIFQDQIVLIITS